MLISTLPISPDVGSLKRQLRSFCAKVAVLPEGADEAYVAVEQLRHSLPMKDGPATTDDLKLALVINALLDLNLQGWALSITPDGLHLNERPASPETLAVAKERIRKRHLQERNAQLRESAVTEFINSMERNRLTKKGWHSIFSVMRDGDELACSLKRAAEVHEPALRDQRLKEAIDPFIQFVDSQGSCPETGLRLNDIWRYFRHTWTTAYKSVPGRSMMILIRDRARPCHPVIGIAALGSSVVQQAVRDRWIGWDKESAIVEFCELATRKKTKRLLQRLEAQINDVYKADLIEEGLLTRHNLKRPTAAVSEVLRRASLKAIESHRKYPSTADLKRNVTPRDTDWKKLARTSLFKSKRCKHLATLLSIRAEFIRMDLEKCSLPELQRTMKTPAIKRCVGQLIRLVKADRVGINMMDITVCGAIAPYNPILGGKLICTLLCSPEVIHAYRERYQQQVSVIASSMAGKEIRRNPQLVLLATTSLYGGGSSQYNRLRFPVGELGGEPSEVLGFYELGRSEGFGSFHFSKETVRIAQALLGRLESGRKVNSIFGEGVNPLMRKMREALTMVGLPSDILLRHGNKRIIYGVPLAKNFRALLLGLETRAVYYLPLTDAAAKTENLSAFWRRRWLSKRVDNEDVLFQVTHHKLTYPVQHGAKVEL
jgi:hypothetical protein